MWRGYHKLGSDEMFNRVAVAAPQELPTASPSGRIRCIDGDSKFALVSDDLIDAAMCQEILDKAQTQGFSDALLNTGDDRQEIGELSPTIRKGKRSIIHDTSLAAGLWERIALLVPNQDTVPGARYKGKWRATSVNPCLRVLKYEVGDHFELHQDGSYTSQPSRSADGSVVPGRRSFLTLQIYLNQGGGVDFAGGSTRFFKDVAKIIGAAGDVQAEEDLSAQVNNTSDRTGNEGVDEAIEDVVPRFGRVLLFQHNVWHCGERVYAGCKYVLRTEIMYEETSGEPR